MQYKPYFFLCSASAFAAFFSSMSLALFAAASWRFFLRASNSSSLSKCFLLADCSRRPVRRAWRKKDISQKQTALLKVVPDAPLNPTFFSHLFTCPQVLIVRSQLSCNTWVCDLSLYECPVQHISDLSAELLNCQALIPEPTLVH